MQTSRLTSTWSWARRRDPAVRLVLTTAGSSWGVIPTAIASENSTAEVARLDDVGVGVPGVAVGDVGRVLAGGQHDHGDDHQVRVGLDLGQHVQAVQPGHVQVKQDQPGPGRIGVLPSTAREAQRTLAVRDQVKTAAAAGLGEGLVDHQRVAGVIVDDQHVRRVAARTGHATLSWSRMVSVHPVSVPPGGADAPARLALITTATR